MSGKLIVYCGPLGQGQMVKLIGNAVAAGNAAGVGQALLVGSRTGVDLDALTIVMAAGSGGSTMLELKARRCASTITRRCSSSCARVAPPCSQR